MGGSARRDDLIAMEDEEYKYGDEESSFRHRSSDQQENCEQLSGRAKCKLASMESRWMCRWIRR